MIGVGRLVPSEACGCGEAGTAFLSIEYPGLDGTIHADGGRVCQAHGASYAAEIPPDVGPITIHIYDWRGPRVTIGVHPRETETRKADAA